MIRYATITNPGGRPVNEDSIGVFEKDGMHCFVVCDGLGGHGMGDVASKLVKDVFGVQLSNCQDKYNFLPVAFNCAQDSLMAEQIVRKAKRNMKTTCVAMFIDDKKVSIGHVGDSRLYAFKRNKVKFRTLDHSIPQMLVLSKEIKESEIRNHPQRSIVLRVMGVEWETPQYELMKPVSLNKYQAFLLCTDGFWELIDESDMSRLLKESSSPEEWLAEMKKVICQNGEGKDMDNYSAIAIWNEK